MTAIRHNKQAANVADSDIERSVGAEELTVFADMKALLGAEIEDKLVELPVINRQSADSSLYVRFNATFDFDTFNSWLKQATNRRTKKLDPKNLGLIVLHNTCAGFLIEKRVGQETRRVEYLVDNQSATFDSRAIQEMVGTMGGWSGAITATYGNDGHMLLTMNRIIEEAGYSEIDLDDVDGYDPLGR